MPFFNKYIYSVLLALTACCLSGCASPIYSARNNIFTPFNQNKSITIMDFAQPISITPIEPGWYHYTFFWHEPMQIDFVTKSDIPAIKLSTDNAASILIRHVEIDLQTYPVLHWNWFIEQTIKSNRNEKYWWGDDHPARLVIFFQTGSGKKRSMEIVWGNKLKAGEYKYTSFSHHYVVRGGTDDLNKWIDEEVNLLQVYHTVWEDHTPAKVMAIGIFTDSDNTNSRTICYFSKITMHKHSTE